MRLPKTRTTEIIEQEAGEELMIYDLQVDKVYTLNETSKNVYLACGRRMTFDELKREHKFTDDLIHFSLCELAVHNLVEDYTSTHFAGLSRREVIKKVGLATMIALPVIAGLTAPTAALTASNCAAANTVVFATNTNPTNDTTTNQNAIAPKLIAQCCSNSYRDFISNGCSFGVGERCDARGTCN